MTEQPRLKREWIGRHVRLKTTKQTVTGVRFRTGEIMHVYGYYRGLKLESIRACPECTRRHRQKIERVPIEDVELVSKDHVPMKRVYTLPVQAYILDRGRTPGPDIWVQLERMEQRDGTDKWAVIRGQWCLCKSGDFILQPQPSSRTAEFLEATRWDTAQAAYEAWVQAGRPKR